MHSVDMHIVLSQMFTKSYDNERYNDRLVASVIKLSKYVVMKQL